MKHCSEGLFSTERVYESKATFIAHIITFGYKLIGASSIITTSYKDSGNGHLDPKLFYHNKMQTYMGFGKSFVPKLVLEN